MTFAQFLYFLKVESETLHFWQKDSKESCSLAKKKKYLYLKTSPCNSSGSAYGVCSVQGLSSTHS